MRQVTLYRSPTARGFTLVELMLVVAVVAILAAIAVPAFLDSVAKNKVKAAAEDIYGLVLQARSETPIRDASISVSIDEAATPWCVGISTTANCDCTNTTSCVLDVAGTDVLHVVDGGDHPDVAVDAVNFAVAGPTFQLPRRNVDDDGTIQISDGDWQLDIQISEQGRISICNPNDNAMPGYEECSP